MTIVRELDLDTLILRSGGHSPGEDMCVMEAVAFVAGEPWSDHPECASVVIGAFMRNWNDALDDEGRQKLKPYIPRLVGSKASKAVENKRAWLCTDWLIHHQAPAWLDLAGCHEQATALRALPPIISSAVAKKHQPVLDAARTNAYAARDAAWNAARDAAWNAAGAAAGDAAWDAAGAAARNAAGAAARAAAWDAARAAAWDAAWDAAWNAARDAAWNAARDAAWNAARDAARDAAWNAARDAARDALKPTVISLQESAFELLDAMLVLR